MEKERQQVNLIGNINKRINMIDYAIFDTFKIGYDTTLRKFFITSKNNGQVEIGGFDLAVDAIEFATKRVS